MMRAALRQALLGSTRPTWEWDFSKELATPRLPGVSFTRATTATYFNSAGVLSSASSGTPRFDYDPVTLSPLGYLAEMASTNSITRSAAFDNAAWTKNRATVVADATTAPDGASSADSLVESIDNDNHQIQAAAVTVVANAPFGWSCFFKAAEDSFITLVVAGATGAVWIAATANLSAGTISKTGNGASGTLTSSGIRAVGGGWYRVWMIGSINDTAAYPTIYLTNSGTPSYGTFGQVVYAGNTSNGIYAWGAQFETGGVGVTSYIPTAGSTVTRNQDVLTLPLTSLPGWSASQGGVLVAAYRLHTRVPSGGGNQNPLYLNDGSINNSLHMQAQYGGAGVMGWAMYSGGGAIGNQAGAVVATFTRRKQAIGWQSGRIINAADGSLTAAADTGAVALPIAMTTMDIGRYISAGLNGTLESIAYYRGQRPDAFVQAVSR